MEYQNEAYNIVKQGPRKIPDHFTRFGKLVAFSDLEKDRFNAILHRIQQYIKQQSFKRPLCIGVFGHPGSGKSFTVKEIIGEAEKAANKDVTGVEKLSIVMHTFNLTQFSTTQELSEQLLGKTIASDENTIPAIFFDEFDAPLNGSPLGWLSWFLAPMNDGHFQLRGITIPLRRAVYVFAGGTSSTFQDFNNRTDPEFINAKGPDFARRLRGGYLDIYGPNEQPARPLRRAIIIHKALTDRSETLWANNKPILEISPKLTDAFLRAGRFRHGAGSIEAIVEMCTVRPQENVEVDGYKAIDFRDLPRQFLLESHVDRGPLDGSEIGGGLGLSAGADPDRQSDYEFVWREVAKKLWEQGATLVYGGHAEKGGLTQLLVDEIESLPTD